MLGSIGCRFGRPNRISTMDRCRDPLRASKLLRGCTVPRPLSVDATMKRQSVALFFVRSCHIKFQILSPVHELFTLRLELSMARCSVSCCSLQKEPGCEGACPTVCVNSCHVGWPGFEIGLSKTPFQARHDEFGLQSAHVPPLLEVFWRDSREVLYDPFPSLFRFGRIENTLFFRKEDDSA